MLLLRFGFEERWVNMIMNYVSSVRYAICINGKITSAIVPERGLRQGDPLSPYLFILCSEWLNYSLSKLQAERSIEGIKVSRGAPYVTHLIFADDCLLLFKVGDGTTESLSTLLKNYEHISGQVVNYNKSEIVLSPNVNDTIRSTVQTHLSVKLVSHHDKYLGLPLTLKRKLTLNFSGYKPSFCWRSIVKGFELLRAGSNHDQNGSIRWTENSTGNFELSSAYKLMMRLHGMDGSQDIGCSDYSQRQNSGILTGKWQFLGKLKYLAGVAFMTLF
ncbi:hypothetical protein QQ045_030282 [Rhodiola kirilowii]